VRPPIRRKSPKPGTLSTFLIAFSPWWMSGTSPFSEMRKMTCATVQAPVMGRPGAARSSRPRRIVRETPKASTSGTHCYRSPTRKAPHRAWRCGALSARDCVRSEPHLSVSPGQVPARCADCVDHCEAAEQPYTRIQRGPERERGCAIYQALVNARRVPFEHTERDPQQCKWSNYLTQFLARAIWRTNSASAGPHVGSAVVSPAITSRCDITTPSNSTNLRQIIGSGALCGAPG
jgi:hypothetical protein